MSLITNFRSALFALTVVFTVHSHAGVPVIDAANVAQAVMQVEAWAKQNLQMADQIKQSLAQVDQLKTMSAKLDGMRGLGTILNDPAIRASLPPIMRDAANMLLNPSSASNNPAALAALLKSFGVSTAGDARTGQSGADSLLNMQAVLAASQQRETQLQRLGERVNSSADAKESLDLLNRNTLEAAAINNQLLQTTAAIEAARKLEELRQIARTQSMFRAMRSGAAAP